MLSLEDRIQNLFERAGYSVRLNPLSDGNCQFAAIANQLQAHNVTAISSFDLRELVVNLEFQSSSFNVRPDFGELIDDSQYSSFEDYINRMRMHTTFGAHLTLQAIRELYFVRINVVSTEGSNHNRMIEPQENSVDILTLSIGYDPESLHYLSISEIIDFQIHDLTGNGNGNGRRDMEVGSEQDGDGQMSDENGDDEGRQRTYGRWAWDHGGSGEYGGGKMGRRITKTGMVWQVTQWRIEVVMDIMMGYGIVWWMVLDKSLFSKNLSMEIRELNVMQMMTTTMMVTMIMIMRYVSMHCSFSVHVYVYLER